MRTGIKLIAKAKYFLNKSRDDNIGAIAAQSAFFLILSLVPFLMFAFAILSFLNLPREFYDTYLKQVVTNDFSGGLKAFIETAYDNSVSVAFTTIIVALWSAGKGLYSITEGINRIYKIKSNKPWIVKRIFAMGYTMLMFIVMVLSLGVLVLTGFFDDKIKPFIEGMPYVVVILYSLRYLIIFVFLIIMISLAMKLYLYNKVVDKRWAKFRLQLPGVVLTSLCWMGLTYGIRIYVNYFNGFSIYGSLTTIVIIMIWFYFCMYILLYGIQFNYINRREIYNFSIRNLFTKKKIDKKD